MTYAHTLDNIDPKNAVTVRVKNKSVLLLVCAVLFNDLIVVKCCLFNSI